MKLRVLSVLLSVAMFLALARPTTQAAPPPQDPAPTPGAADAPAAAEPPGELPANDPATPAAPASTHSLLINGFVSSFSVSDPVVYWLTQPASCTPSPDATRLLRTRNTGWDLRYLFNRLPAGGAPCPYQVYSNIVADSQHVYWMDSTGLVRLPVTANPADVPETVMPEYPGIYTELALLDEYVVGLSNGVLWVMPKAFPSNYFTYAIYGTAAARMLKTDGRYMYLIRTASGSLERYDIPGNYRLIDSGVSDYAAAGPETLCFLITCYTYEYVYYVKSSAPLSIQRYDGFSGVFDSKPVYTATLPSGYTARLYGLTMGAPRLLASRPLFFWEKRWVPCFCFETNSTDYLTRLNRGVIHVQASKTSWAAEQTKVDNTFLFWKDQPTINFNSWGSVYRIPQDATALPVVNLRVWDWEINQSVQNQDMTIGLVRNKRTFFRLFVSSAGADVPGVTARLTAHWGGAARDTIAPITPLITVRNVKTKDIIAQQFIFELPLHWTTHNDLRLEPVLNPFAFPLEPTYADNRFTQLLGPFEFRDNPAARFRLVRVSYLWSGGAGTSRDQDAIVSWLYRAYPMGIEPGAALPGFDRYSDNNLGTRVQDFNNEKECQSLNRTAKGGADDRNLCASFYLHSQLEMLRRTNAIPTDAYIYASVRNLARGSASSTAPVSNGPDRLSGGTSFALAGYYAGHELGHLLNRGHPVAMSDDPATKTVTEGCGHSRTDAGFPYIFGWIGEFSNKNYGLDSRMNVPGGSVRVMRYSEVRDVMTYCGTPDQWLSDYTYNGIYDWLTQHPGPARPEQARLPQTLGRSQSGAAILVDGWLSLSGMLAADGSSGLFNYIERSDSLELSPAQVPGPFAIRLLDGTGATLADYSFTPLVVDEAPDWLSFTESVPFAEGTRVIQIVHAGSDTVVMESAVSANSPVVNSVAARPGAAPAGVLAPQVTLSWNASDPDGDPLTFDVLYSPDGGVSFRPVAANVSGSSVEVDTTLLPGGTGQFRVVASDGANASYTDSDPVTLAVQPPQVHILTPTEGQTVQYSTHLNFSGYADDVQDGSLTGDMLTWHTQFGSFATGPNATAAILPTGWVTITLSAQNSAGVTGSASVKIYVGDDLADPPAAAEVSPTAVNFQAENGSPAPLQAAVEIAQVGGPGTIDWTADLGGAAWLSADTLAGTVPYSLTLTADPTGLAPNSTLTTTLTIQAAVRGGGTQTIEIPVTLQTGLGDVWSPPAVPDIPLTMYLPVMSR